MAILFILDEENSVPEGVWQALEECPVEVYIVNTKTGERERIAAKVIYQAEEEEE